MSPTSAVIVTGGASGIGRASAEAVAAQGRAVAVWDLNADGAIAA
ncbi:MAG: SDR family NAD(P)-dependent oxidoreductase, partial [Actinobacteria bacterium]|nr:SDR family NAD(P)-dependent oxidoreductase [Actinomycetota bacterium]